MLANYLHCGLAGVNVKMLAPVKSTYVLNFGNLTRLKLLLVVFRLSHNLKLSWLTANRFCMRLEGLIKREILFDSLGQACVDN